MTLDEKMLGAVQAYFDLFNTGDGVGIAGLFSDAAEIHDPVGTPPKIGKAEITAFYAMATRAGSRLEQMGPVRLAGNEAAFPFRCHVKAIKSEDKAVDVELPTGPMIIDIIDVFQFDNSGKIVKMQAYCCLLYTSPSPRDKRQSRMPSSA